MTSAVSTRGLSKRFKTTVAVDGADIDVPEGCCCGFLGKNGAGKTTALKMLVGLIRPSAGKISIMGREQVYGKRGGRAVGYLPDVPNFYGHMTGAEFLDLCAKLCEIPAAGRRAHVESLLARVGLEKTRARISGYSRGMKQRLGIAQAMINEPPIIFMDEPISALDPIGRRDVAQIIRSLKGATVVFSTHILADVEHICDYALIIDKGKIIAQDYMENLRRKHADGAAKVRFFNESDARIFGEKALGATLDAQRVAPLEFLARADSGGVEELSRRITALLHKEGLAVESFGARAPTLEDIFYKEIGDE